MENELKEPSKEIKELSSEQKEEMNDLKRKIMTLEWDKKLRQINFAKSNLLEGYKKQLSEIEEQTMEKDGNKV